MNISIRIHNAAVGIAGGVLVVVLSASPAFPQSREILERLEGITHYGMPIEETVKTYHSHGSSLTIIYSRTRSDDNMDKYVQRFYEEFLKQVEAWLADHPLPAKETTIVISNCKFCKIGYCLKKGVKEIRLTSLRDGKASKEIACTHIEIIDETQYRDIAQSAVTVLLDR